MLKTSQPFARREKFLIRGRLFLLICCFFGCIGATYYVDDSGGNDLWNGLSRSAASEQRGPWQHVAMVNRKQFAPGDEILFKRGGIWREMLAVPASGLPGRPITVGAYGSGPPPVLDGELVRATLTCQKSWVILRGLELRNSGKAGLLIQSPRGQDLNHVAVEKIIVHNAARDGIVVMNNNNLVPAENHPIANITITECNSHNNGYHGIAIDDSVSNVLISHNEVANNGLRPIASYGWHGITLYGENAYNYPNNVIIEHNDVYGQQQGISSKSKEGSGIQCDDNSSNVIIRYNYCHKNGGPGVSLHIATNIQVYYNILSENGSSNYGDSGLSINNSRDVKAYNNVIYNNNAYGIFIYSNWLEKGATRNIKLSNNIIYNDVRDEKRRALRLWTRSGSLFPNLISTHNCWFCKAPGQPMVEWLAAGIKTFGEYQKISGQDWSPFSFEANPAFVDPARGNFRLRQDSPCTRQGADFGLTRDFEGRRIPPGAKPSIGAYETAIPPERPLEAKY